MAEAEFQFLACERQTSVTEDKKLRLRGRMAEALGGPAAPVPPQVGCGQVTPPFSEFFTPLQQSHSPPALYARAYGQHSQPPPLQARVELESSSPPSSANVGSCLTQLGQVVSQVASGPNHLADYSAATYSSSVGATLPGGAAAGAGIPASSSSSGSTSTSSHTTMQQGGYCEDEELPSCAYAHPHLHGLPFLVHGQWGHARACSVCACVCRGEGGAFYQRNHGGKPFRLLSERN